MELVHAKQQSAFKALQPVFGYKNAMQAPKVTKVVVSVGTGSFTDKKKAQLVADRIALITGQKPALRSAKKSIASFKLRTGDPVGYQVTLRGKRMEDFLTRLIHIAFPRTKDFRGLNPGSIDEMGNYSIGIREHVIFPETPDEELKDVFGMSITIVTNAGSKDESLALLRHIGMPLKKVADKKEVSKRKRVRVAKPALTAAPVAPAK
ncbi:TPA: 50S ribosomal protein L5 [Candidatus Taylorbacteria bacterium]|nr:50S ribosomal protein L5 [Candidatus Taylorbacteria bacterium]